MSFFGQSPVGVSTNNQERMVAMKWRGVLLHMTHYDPWWMAQKKKEKRFDRDTMNACLDAAAEAGMSFVVIDIKDEIWRQTCVRRHIFNGFMLLDVPYCLLIKPIQAVVTLNGRIGQLKLVIAYYLASVGYTADCCFHI